MNWSGKESRGRKKLDVMNSRKVYEEKLRSLRSYAGDEGESKRFCWNKVDCVESDWKILDSFLILHR